MNAATRNQAAGLLAHLLGAERAAHPGTLDRARRILEAAKRRPFGRMPAAVTNKARRWPGLEPYDLSRPQAEYCRGCAFLGACNVALMDGERCADYAPADEPTPCLECGGLAPECRACGCPNVERAGS